MDDLSKKVRSQRITIILLFVCLVVMFVCEECLYHKQNTIIDSYMELVAKQRDNNEKVLQKYYNLKNNYLYLLEEYKELKEGVEENE